MFLLKKWRVEDTLLKGSMGSRQLQAQAPRRCTQVCLGAGGGALGVAIGDGLVERLVFLGRIGGAGGKA